MWHFQETIKIKLIHDQYRPGETRFKGFFHGVKTIVQVGHIIVILVDEGSGSYPG